MYEETARVTHETTLRHAGTDKTLDFIIKSQCIAPGINKTVRNIIAHCRECASQKAYPKKMTTPMRSIYPPADPGTTLAIDHTGPHPMAQGYRYILAIPCITSKHLVLIPQKAITAVETARALLWIFIAHLI